MRPPPIPRVVAGETPSMVDSALANQVIDTANALRGMRTIGCEFLMAGDKATLQVELPDAQAIAEALALPLQVQDASDEQAVRVSVTAGYAQYLEPTIGGVSLFAAEPPTLAVNQAGEWHIWLRGEVDIDNASTTFAQITGAEVVAHFFTGELIDAAWTPLERFRWPLLRLAVVKVAEVDGDLTITDIRNAWGSDVVWLQTFDRWTATGTTYIAGGGNE